MHDLLIKDALVVMPLITKIFVATGISNAMPNANTSLKMKPRYWLISVMTWMDSGAIPIKNLKIIGQTTKKAKLTPPKNKITVENNNGPVKVFSFL